MKGTAHGRAVVRAETVMVSQRTGFLCFVSFAAKRNEDLKKLGIRSEERGVLFC